MRRVVAMGGGGFSMEPENPLLDQYILSLTGTARPKVCFVPTASGDADSYVAKFYRAFSAFDCQPSDLPLFSRTIGDLESFVLSQDVIYVGGGNTANLLAVWRVHGLDRLLWRAWDQGTILCGLSAGMNCWFERCVTDSFEAERLQPLHDGMGLLPGNCCPHYDTDPRRRLEFHRLIGTGEFDGGWAADDGAALVFHGESLHEVVASRSGAAAYWVAKSSGGEVVERSLDTRYLGLSCLLSI